jgi:hypothetical protein
METIKWLYAIKQRLEQRALANLKQFIPIGLPVKWSLSSISKEKRNLIALMKQNAMRLAGLVKKPQTKCFTPSDTLVYDEDRSESWIKWKPDYWRENLEVLKLLRAATVKRIYIDPYNTGKDLFTVTIFISKRRWKTLK